MAVTYSWHLAELGTFGSLWSERNPPLDLPGLGVSALKVTGALHAGPCIAPAKHPTMLPDDLPLVCRPCFCWAPSVSGQ